MRATILIVQILVTLVVTAAIMPVLLATVPALRRDAVGAAVLGGVLVVAFVLLRLVWPSARGRPKGD